MGLEAWSAVRVCSTCVVPDSNLRHRHPEEGEAGTPKYTAMDACSIIGVGYTMLNNGEKLNYSGKMSCLKGHTAKSTVNTKGSAAGFETLFSVDMLLHMCALR